MHPPRIGTLRDAVQPLRDNLAIGAALLLAVSVWAAVKHALGCAAGAAGRLNLPATNEEVLRRINEDREKYNAARVKLNFFYVVLTGGRILFLLGLLLTLFSMIRLIRRDAQTKLQRITGLID